MSVLTFDKQLTASTLFYLGRYDTKLKIEVQYEQGAMTKIFYGMLFTESDVDKDIPIWLSTTPPPWA